MSLIDYVILAAIAALVVLAVRYSIRHKNHCGGDCSHCAGCQGCDHKPPQK